MPRLKPAPLVFAAFAATLAVSGGQAGAQTDATQAPAPVVRKSPPPAKAASTPAKTAAPTAKPAAPKPYQDSFPVVHMKAGQIEPGPGIPVKPVTKPAAAAPQTGAAVKTPAATSPKPMTALPSKPLVAGTTAPKAVVSATPTAKAVVAAAGTPKPVVTKPAVVAPAPTVPKAPVVKPAVVAPPPAVAKPAMQKPVVPAAAPAAQPATNSAPAAPTTSAINRTVIVLDPAHGGADNGARLSDSILEKDVDLSFAFKLRSLLQARGFTVVLTRDSDSPVQSNDPGAQLTLDNRAGLANHARAVACLLIHATGSGTGVHLYHSELTAAPGEAANLPWLSAQAAWVNQSTALAQKVSQALTRGSIPLVSSAASVRPVDSLTCPALVLELAPKESGDAETITDASYQQSVAEALAGALVFWKNQVQPPVKIAPASAEVQP